MNRFWRPYAKVWAGLVMVSSVLSAEMQPFLGEINWVSYNYAPTGWDFCDGQLLSTATYSALFAKIGYTYGGSGSLFALPNVIDRVVLGVGSGPGLTPRALGNTGGQRDVSLDVSQMPTHSHGALVNNSSAGTTDPTGNALASGSTIFVDPGNAAPLSPRTVGNAGQGLAHENRMPFLRLHCIIATDPAITKN